jgi:hypothetical protein
MKISNKKYLGYWAPNRNSGMHPILIGCGVVGAEKDTFIRNRA